MPSTIYNIDHEEDVSLEQRAFIREVNKQKGTTRWRLANNNTEILEAPADSIIFCDGVEELADILDVRLGAEKDMTFIDTDRFSSESIRELNEPRFALDLRWDDDDSKADDFYNRLIAACEAHGRVSVYRCSFSREDLHKRGLICDDNYVVYDPKTAAKKIKKIESQRKAAEKRSKTYRSMHIYNWELESFLADLKNKMPFYSGLLSPRVRHDVCWAIIHAAEAWNWTYGKGTYRGMDSFRHLKAMWIRKHVQYKNMPVAFKVWMNAEIKKRAMPAVATIKKRSKLYGFCKNEYHPLNKDSLTVALRATNDK